MEFKCEYSNQEIPSGWGYYVLLETPYGPMVGHFYNVERNSNHHYVGISTPNGLLNAIHVGATRIALIARHSGYIGIEEGGKDDVL